MPRSGSNLRSDRALWGDEHAVSEVIGFTLTFGILSMLLVVSLVGFNATKQDAEEEVVSLRASSAAQRVATAAVQMSLLVEQQQTDGLQRLLELPSDMEGHHYTVAIDSSGVRVDVPGAGVSKSAPLFGAGQSVSICDMDVSGGPLWLRYDDSAPCGTGLYLEET